MPLPYKQLIQLHVQHFQNKTTPKASQTQLLLCNGITIILTTVLLSVLVGTTLNGNIMSEGMDEYRSASATLLGCLCSQLLITKTTRVLKMK